MTAPIDTSMIFAKPPDRIEVVLEGQKVVTIRAARTDPEMAWVIDVDEAGTYIVIKTDP